MTLSANINKSTKLVDCEAARVAKSPIRSRCSRWRSVALPHSANWACEGPFLQQERWMILRRASTAPGPAPSYEGDDRTDQDHNSGSHRKNSNPLPDPALFSFIRRHVTSLMFFSASCRSRIATFPLTLRALRFSVSNPQQLLPLPQLPLETHALGDLKCPDDAVLYLLPSRGALPAVLACGANSAFASGKNLPTVRTVSIP
jgi:hypothetical protein